MRIQGTRLLQVAIGTGLAIMISGCAAFERSEQSGYSANSPARMQVYREKPSVRDAKYDTLQTKTQIKKLENAIRTKKELEQYSKVLPLLKNDEERLEFLQEEGYEARNRWLNQRSVLARTNKIQDEMRELIDAQDIAVGMPQNLVKKSWGDPENIEVSGNPQFRNERWKYTKYISTPDGYKLERKMVYFEAGKVVGWEVE